VSDPRLIYTRYLRARLIRSEIGSGLAVPFIVIVEGTVIGCAGRQFDNE